MEIEELWSAIYGSREVNLKGVEQDSEYFWRLSALDAGSHNEVVVDLDRKDLKELHSAIEHELYPERYLSPVPRTINFDQLFDHMAELGFTEEMIDRMLDKLQIAEDAQRKE